MDMMNGSITEKTMPYSEFCTLCDKEILISKNIFGKVYKPYIKRRFLNMFQDNPQLECEILTKIELPWYHMLNGILQIIYAVGKDSFSDKARACKLFPGL